jgi:lipoprotein-anchoring transpeptidase ErfK/SrfK
MSKFLFFVIGIIFSSITLFAGIIDIVHYNTEKDPGTVFINTQEKKLYFLVDYQLAYVYPIAVGKKKHQFFGKYTISKKVKWPAWYPTTETLREKPWLPDVVEGGRNNPLGARAMYLGDSLYRIHGTNNPNSIGKEASRGCIRMYNDDAIELYSLINTGAEVYVQ